MKFVAVGSSDKQLCEALTGRTVMQHAAVADAAVSSEAVCSDDACSGSRMRQSVVVCAASVVSEAMCNACIDNSHVCRFCSVRLIAICGLCL